MTTGPLLEVAGVSKRFPNGQLAVDDVSLGIGGHEFFALLGPSGCGKTTLLRMVAGLETPSAGRVVIDGEDLTGVPANRRPVNLVFQSYAVFPHMTVRQNVEYGLMVTGTPKAETRRRGAEALGLVRLEGLADRSPNQLSGGQRQRVALARALVKRPKVLLLDEPLSALDAKLREEMQAELSQLHRALGIAFVIVTHDQDEALSMATRIAVMDAGRVCQVGTPHELYERPASRLVAEFIGRVNLFDATLGERGGRRVATSAELGEVDVSGLAGDEAEGAVALAIRPERLRLSAARPEGAGLVAVPGTVRHVAYYGDVSRVAVRTATGRDVTASVPNDGRERAAASLGEAVWASWEAGEMRVLGG